MQAYPAGHLEPLSINAEPGQVLILLCDYLSETGRDEKNFPQFGVTLKDEKNHMNLWVMCSSRYLYFLKYSLKMCVI
jgi:hypothetical protein